MRAPSSLLCSIPPIRLRELLRFTFPPTAPPARELFVAACTPGCTTPVDCACAHPARAAPARTTALRRLLILIVLKIEINFLYCNDN